MNIHIYVSYHIPFLKLNEPCFVPIEVGRAIKETRLDMIGDDTGDNISRYNPYFSEVVSHYWAWKNDRDCDYVGFLHYRRYLTFKDYSNRGPVTEKNCKEIFGLNQKDVEEAIKNYDIIVPYALNVGNMYRNTCNPFGTTWANMLIAQMKEVKPHYSNAIDRFYQGDKAHLYNLFIMKRELFDEYCDFAFGTMLPLYEKIGNKAPYNTLPRFFGYVSEQFINIYIEYLREIKKDLRVGLLSPVRVTPYEDRYIFSSGAY